ncbi:GIY-YIG nuclease family protein [Pedobacter punctiformis]|uniref:GIY-YIG nuclease family protein n=1 Tax=Pedobacter punctiformis TaxID=3004097 RepID=UPI003D181D1E
MYYTYILYSTLRNRYYIGCSSDLENRIKTHNTNHRGFTGHTGDWIIVWKEVFSTRSEAIFRENQIKKWKSRKMVEKLINSAGS